MPARAAASKQLDCRKDRIDDSTGIRRKGAPHVRLVLDAGSNSRVRENAVERRFEVASHNPVAHLRLVCDIDFVGDDRRARRTTRIRHCVKTLAIAPAEEKPVAALRALKRERLADSRTCTGYEDVH